MTDRCGAWMPRAQDYCAAPPHADRWHRTAAGQRGHLEADAKYARTDRRRETQAMYESTIKGKLRSLRRDLKRVRARIRTNEERLAVLLAQEDNYHADEG